MTLPPNEICYQLTARASRRSTRKRTLACQPSRPLGPPVPRIARLMALAIRLGDRIEREISIAKNWLAAGTSLGLA
jgi:hypothetical protein